LRLKTAYDRKAYGGMGYLWVGFRGWIDGARLRLTAYRSCVLHKLEARLQATTWMQTLTHYWQQQIRRVEIRKVVVSSIRNRSL